MADAFRAAQEAIDAYDPQRLREVLAREPELVRATDGPNQNTLIGMAAGTCDDRSVALLLDAGADPDQPNVHGWTALHQAAYVNAVHLLDMLLAAGARCDRSARGDGGTPLVVALFSGHVEVADGLVARCGVEPRNLRAAAGAGDVALVRELIGTREAGRRRAFHRPHSGFPEWAPSDDPRQVLDEALAYAARSDRIDVLDVLVDAGADVEADVYRGTPLIWAAACGRAAAVERLLALGADPTTRGTFGGPTHGDGITALHIAAEAGAQDVCRLLLEAGADPSVVDGHGYGSPEGWARHNGHAELSELIRSYAA
jgi:ankyrin repeat protein